jgi:hypothetical protein
MAKEYDILKVGDLKRLGRDNRFAQLRLPCG